MPEFFFDEAWKSKKIGRSSFSRPPVTRPSQNELNWRQDLKIPPYQSAA